MNLAYSVIIPAFNAQATIVEAISSVLNQTAPAEVIFVVDDGSTDSTGAVAAQVASCVRVIRKANGGPGSATTAGLQAAATPFIATLDADDLWLPHKMAQQLEFLHNNPEISGLFALGRLFRTGEMPDPEGTGAVKRLWTRTTMVYRTDAARHIGDLVDLPGYLGELIDWLSRGRDLGQKHHMLDEVLALRRVRAGSLSDTGDSDRTRGYLHAVRKAIERKKQEELARNLRGLAQ